LAKAPIYLDHCRRSNAVGDRVALTRGVQFDKISAWGNDCERSAEPHSVERFAEPRSLFSRTLRKRCSAWR